MTMSESQAQAQQQLVRVFEALGLSPGAAQLAAAGRRGPVPAPPPPARDTTVAEGVVEYDGKVLSPGAAAWSEQANRRLGLHREPPKPVTTARLVELREQGAVMPAGTLPPRTPALTRDDAERRLAEALVHLAGLSEAAAAAAAKGRAR